MDLPSVISAAQRAVGHLETIEDAKDLRDKAEAMRKYAANMKAGLKAQNECAEIKIRCERVIGQMTREIEGAQGATSLHAGKKFKREELKAAGLSSVAAHRCEKIADVPEDAFEAEVVNLAQKDKELTSGHFVSLGKQINRRADIDLQREGIKSGEIVLPDGVFEVIVIDPPWPYGNADHYNADGFRGTCPYPEESIEELAARKMPAADNCILWLWTTHRFMPDAFVLLEAWGFQHKVILTWVKDRMGTGRWLRSQSEFCILAVKGKPTVDLTNQSTVLQAPMREHSRKPDEFYALVESLCIGRKLDFFSREKREGWAQVGNEPEKFDNGMEG